MAKHNKKRNVGLIHEQLVRYASEKIVVKERDIAENAMNILNKCFLEGTELYKEFRLFNSLVHTKVQDRDIARRIIDESRIACKNHDENRLRSEKSMLIKEINHNLDERNFYSRKIPEYKIFATVQALLNEWRGADKLAPDERVLYESVLEDWLVHEGKNKNLEQNKNANPLVLNLMVQKFNKKYASLNEDQIKLLELKLTGDDAGAKKYSGLIKEKVEKALSRFYDDCSNRVLNEKRDVIEKRIREFRPGSSDESIKRALMLAALTNELEDDNE